MPAPIGLRICRPAPFDLAHDTEYNEIAFEFNPCFLNCCDRLDIARESDLHIDRPRGPCETVLWRSTCSSSWCYSYLFFTPV
jgi:hypothetical protein